MIVFMLITRKQEGNFMLSLHDLIRWSSAKLQGRIQVHVHTVNQLCQKVVQASWGVSTSMRLLVTKINQTKIK